MSRLWEDYDLVKQPWRTVAIAVRIAQVGLLVVTVVAILGLIDDRWIFLIAIFFTLEFVWRVAVWLGGAEERRRMKQER